MSMQENPKGNAVSWIALTLAAIAVIVAVLAYGGRLSENEVETIVENRWNDVVTDARIQVARLVAATKLSALKTGQEERQNFDEMQNQISQIKSDLSDAYASSNRSDTLDWERLEQRFDDLDQQVRRESLDSLITIDGLVSELREDTGAGS